MNIDRGKFGIHGYGQSIAEQLKEKYAGRTITDVQFNFFSEGFSLILDSGEELYFSVPGEDEGDE